MKANQRRLLELEQTLLAANTANTANTAAAVDEATAKINLRLDQQQAGQAQIQAQLAQLLAHLGTHATTAAAAATEEEA